MAAISAGGKDDIGTILARIQDDLQLMRSTVTKDGVIDRQTLESLLSRTEKEIQTVSERVLTNSMDKVSTVLPPVVQEERRDTVSKNEMKRRRRRKKSIDIGLLEMSELTSRDSPIHRARLSAAEETQLLFRARLMNKPSLPATRNLLSQHYNLPLSPESRGSRSKVKGKVFTGGTFPPLTSLPRQQGAAAISGQQPLISDGDAERGLLSLIERQLIPPAADIILDPPPVRSRTLELLSPTEQHVRPAIAVLGNGYGHVVGVRLAPDHMTSEPPNQTTPTLQPIKQPQLTIQQFPVPSATPSDQIMKKEDCSSSSPSQCHQLIIENGQIITSSKEYEMFQLSNSLQWNNLIAVIKLIERICITYAVPMAIISCSRLLELGLEYELGLRLNTIQLVSSMVNEREVLNIISLPGQRFKGHGGKAAAATLIKATYRMYRDRQLYREHQKRVWAVQIISNYWIRLTARHSVKKGLIERREKEVEEHEKRLVGLASRWNEIKGNKRIIIHLPSLGHPLQQHGNETELRMEQSLQLARITDIADPNVEVIYISPVTVDSEVLEYYHKLFNINSSTTNNDAMDRLHIVTLDLSFSPHPLPLSTLLTLNPRAVQRIKRLITGRECYIIPGVINSDDITVEQLLGVPVLGPDSRTAERYSSKVEAKKLFSEANVSTPPSVSGIVSESQLYDELTALIASHPLIDIWIFKLPYHSRGRGFAHCRIADHMKCHQWLVSESERYNTNWSTKWAQEGARRRILQELPEILHSHIKLVNTDWYPSWNSFLADFLSNGGIIEGHPPSSSVTSLTVDLFIDPVGEVSIISTQDQINDGEYSIWGCSVPQCSVPPDVLADSALKVGVVCSGRGIVGHLSIDFITFIHPTTMEQVLWAIDIDIGYSNHLAMLRLLNYVTMATVDPMKGVLTVGDDGGQRYAVISSRVYHSSLPVVHYPVFFQMCKANHIGYDSKEKIGTLFALFDSDHKENMGIICVQRTLSEALMSCSVALTTIHHELSTPGVQGYSNFKNICKELQNVAKLVKDNENDSKHTK